MDYLIIGSVLALLILSGAAQVYYFKKKPRIAFIIGGLSLFAGFLITLHFGQYNGCVPFEYIYALYLTQLNAAMTFVIQFGALVFSRFRRLWLKVLAYALLIFLCGYGMYGVLFFETFAIGMGNASISCYSDYVYSEN